MLGRAMPGQGHVDMRIGAKANHQVGIVHHLRADVAMQVQRRDDRNIGPHHLPHPGQQRAFPVRGAVGHHRAMQVHKDAVQRPRIAQALNDLLGQCGIALGRYRGRWHGTGPDKRHHLPALLFTMRNGAGDGKVHVPRPVDDLRAPAQRQIAAALFECRHVRGTGGKGIAFVDEARKGDTSRSGRGRRAQQCIVIRYSCIVSRVY